MNVHSCLEYQKTRVFQRPLWASKGGVIGDGVSEEGGPHWEVPYSNWGYPGNPQLPPGRGMVSYPPYRSTCTVDRKGGGLLFGAKPTWFCSEYLLLDWKVKERPPLRRFDRPDERTHTPVRHRVCWVSS